MLKITEIKNNKNETVLRLEGKLVEPWVMELEKIYLKHLEKNESILILDFENVSFISSSGIDLLKKIKKRILIINPRPYINMCLVNKGFKDQIK